MKPLTFATVMLMGNMTPTLAIPAANQALEGEDASRCCCDISQTIVSCTYSIDVLQCACLAVACPDGAPTVWNELPLPKPSTEPSPPDEEVQCCCCDISQPAISCKKQPADEGCFCPLVLCPPGVPTVYPESEPMPTPTPTSTTASELSSAPIPTSSGSGDIEDEMVTCCCCDISVPAVSCKMQADSEGCICAMVVCPTNAPTVWPEGMPAPTSPPPSLPSSPI